MLRYDFLPDYSWDDESVGPSGSAVTIFIVVWPISCENSPHATARGRDGMTRKPGWLFATTIMISFMLASCATHPVNGIKITGTWKDDRFNKDLSDFLIISLADEPSIRLEFEDMLVHRLEAGGLHAGASSDIMLLDEKIDRQTVKAAMAGKNYDGVLVAAYRRGQ